MPDRDTEQKIQRWLTNLLATNNQEQLRTERLPVQEQQQEFQQDLKRDRSLSL